MTRSNGSSRNGSRWSAWLRLWARRLLTLLLTAAAGLLLLWLLAWLVPVNDPAGQSADTSGDHVDTTGLRDISFDPSKTPSLHRDISVEPVGQSPILEELVNEGKLPPLAERLPRDPVVMEGTDGVGVYGGTWLRLALSLFDVHIINYRLSGAYLVRWSPLGYPIEPHIARSVESSDDARIWTVTLREGMRWSDGEPYTADDIMYWWQAEANNGYIADAPPEWMISAGKMGDVQRLDQYRVRFVFDEPYPLFLERLAHISELTESPKHYLQLYHPDPEIGDPEAIRRAMDRFQVPSPLALYRILKDWQNPEHPRLWPWVYRSYNSTTPQVFVRNPYYYVVDTAGNQLPYIDRVQFDIMDGQMLGVAAANGRVSMQARHVRFSDYTELMSRQDSAGTRVLHWYPSSRSLYVISPNLNRRVNKDEPSSGFKARLLGDKRFRQALSLAIDRDRVIRAEYSGIGTPSQIAPGPESVFDNSVIADAYAQHDPEAAGRLLDEIGLTQRDYEGYRTFTDGSRMTFYLDYTSFTGRGPTDFVIDDWKQVGVRVIAKERSRSLFYARKDGLLFDFCVWSGGSDYMPQLYPRYYLPYNLDSFFAVGWSKWYMNGGYYESDDTPTPGGIPVPKDHPMYRALGLYEQAMTVLDNDQRVGLMDQVLQIAGENVWTISLATPPPQPVVVQRGFKNVPENALYGVLYASPSNAGIETYFFQNPDDAEQTVESTRRAILEVTPRVVASVSSGGGVSVIGFVTRYGVMILIGVPLIYIIVRYPFIRRRLLIMIPTMAVISIIVFVVIQLPPGDYLSTRIIQLQESGDPADVQAIEDLRELFHYDESASSRYLRWMGVRWFWTFDAEDMGLLQGNLGRSMETTQPVNAMIGDRLLLTLLISLGTIMLTWSLAIPVGIYSAVRQYTMSDYILTLLGFVGMCVPPFLLALVLMAVADVQGLFSPEYAAQPGWSAGKVLDLLKHIWIPVVVLGVGGTAAMIRIMRANLLDELRKPYVVTAQAKGVRPLKLLMKYPVRIALNPFVSGIGYLFPQLVSGGAIVAMVLSLPTIGPLLLRALFTEDMYLAGSLLVLLSMLSVVGTLVSDLLLLWLDPRIRFEGGAR